MQTNLNKIKGPILLFITAFFWGTTFVAQSLGSNYVGPFTYNAGRFIITGIILSLFCIIRDLKVKKHLTIKDFDTPKSTKWILFFATLVGLSLFLGAALQQIGIDLTKSASKSGFISTTYIIFVPLLGLFFHKKVKPWIWLFLLLSLVGSYLISSIGSFNIEPGDMITLVSAMFFALQIVLIDIINPHIDSIKLSAIQFIISGILSLILMFIFEDVSFANIIKASPAILYAAIFSGCIAFTFQIIGQKYTEPTLASMIMSLESVIALIGGVIVLHEVLTFKMIIGCILIFISILFVQIDFKKIFTKK